MASAKRRASGRYMALYYPLAGGVQKSAGTYDTELEALTVAAKMEAWCRTGSAGLSPEEKATMTIGEYAWKWLANHRVERSTKDGYKSYLDAHIIPKFGHIRVAELQREQVRQFLTEIRDVKGLSPASQKALRSCVSAMMQTAWDDGYRSDNPARGIRVDRNSRKRITVMTTEQFGRVHALLPTDGSRLLASLIVATGCRSGEAFVLRVSDLDVEKQKIWFQRALQVVNRERHGVRFHIGDTKTHDIRDVTLNKRVFVRLIDWIADNNLGPDDFLFPRSLVLPLRRRGRAKNYDLTPELLASLGTITAANGKDYNHGTMNGYITAKCRCDYCKQGFSDYRWQRNQSKAGRKPFKHRDLDVVDGNVWRDAWMEACKQADLPFIPTAYQLRHTHASWMIQNGIAPKQVMHRLGHASLSTTDLYVHMVDGTDDGGAADVMDSLGDW